MSAAVRAGYKQTEVGVIPEDWEIHRLEAVAAIIGGGAFKSSDASRTGIRWLKIANVGINEILWQEESFLPKNFAVTHNSFLLHEGDYVLALTRPILGGALKIAVVRKEDSPALLNQRVGKLVAKGSNVVDFVYFHLQTDFFISAMLQSMAGTDPPNISTRQISSIPCALPTSSDEQRTIATALSDVDALLAKLDALIAKKRDLKVATMQQLLTGQTRLLGFSGEWEVKRLGDVVRITTGKKDVNEGNPAGQYPFFTCARAHTYSDNFSFDCEAILIAGNGEVGNLNYFNGKFEAYQRTYVLQNFVINVNYLWHQLNAHLVQSLGIGTIGSSIPYIKMENLVGFEFQSPIDALEQTAIASVLSDMDTELTALEARRDKTRALKQGMMQELLTGRIRLI